MKGITRIKILAVVFVLLCAVAYFSLQKKFSSNTFQSENNEVSIKDTAAIEKITIEKDGRTQVLTREAQGEWKVNNKYEVRTNVMNLLLTGLHLLDVKRPVSEEQKTKVIEALSKKGAHVKVYYLDQIKTIYFTSNESDPNTTYLMLENSQSPYVGYVPGVPGDINNIFKLQEHEWRNRELFTSNPASIQTLNVTYPNSPSDNLEIEYKGGNFLVKNVSQLDTAKLENYLSMYQYVPVAGYFPEKPVQAEDLKTYAVIDLADINSSKSGFIQVFSNLTEDKKNYLGTLGKSGEMVSLNKEIFDRLLVKKSYFSKK